MVLSVVWIVTRLWSARLRRPLLRRRSWLLAIWISVSVHGEHQAARLGYSFNLMADSLQRKLFSWSACRLCSSACVLRRFA